LNKCELYRFVEVAVILAFMVATAVIVVVDPSPGAQAVEAIRQVASSEPMPMLCLTRLGPPDCLLQPLWQQLHNGQDRQV